MSAFSFRRFAILMLLVLVLCFTAGTAAASPPPAPPGPAPGYAVVELVGISQNSHTIPFLMWVANNGQDVYFAVKSTHDVGTVTIGAGSSSASTQIFTKYGPLVPLSVGGTSYNPAAGLSGNTKAAHWTLAWFDGPSTINNILLKADADGNLLFTILVQDAGGHSLYNQTYTLTPYKGDVTAAKIWSGGPLPRPTVYFQLWRTFVPIAGDPNPVPAPVPVPNLPARALPYGVTATTWENIDTTDIYGRRYAFSVVEGSMVNGVFVAGSPGNYQKTEEGLVVTNSWLTRDVTAAKIWRPAAPEGAQVELTLTRHIVNAQGTIVPDAIFSEAVTLNATTGWNHAWADLPQKDAENNVYVYNLAETNRPPSYDVQITKTDMGGGSPVVFTVTNTLIPASVSVKKIYSIPEGTSPYPEKPSVGMQLWQDGVRLGLPVPLSDGATYTWTNLPKYKDAANTKEYAYTVTEPIIPAGYVLTWRVANGVYEMTNTYRAGTFTAKKTWDPPPAPAGAKAVLKLYRLYAAVPQGDPVDTGKTGTLDGIIDSGNPLTDEGEFQSWSYTWQNLPGNDPVSGRT